MPYIQLSITSARLRLRSAMVVRPDTAFANGLNVQGGVSGTIINRGHIGKTSDELVALWNTKHPEDPVMLQA